MGLHFGMCHGPISFMSRVKINDKIGWEGMKDGGTPIFINEPELFGGNKKEGGAVGRFQFLPGDEFQTIPEILAGKVDRTTATMVAYRGQASIWFYEAAGSNRNGFYWSANQPFIPPVEILASRSSDALSGHNPRLWRPARENIIAQTANPAKQPPWFNIATDAVVVTGLADPFGGTEAFSLQDANGTTSFADKVLQNILTTDLPSIQRFIVSIYIKRDAGQSIFSNLQLTNDGPTNLTYNHPTDEIDLVSDSDHLINEFGMLAVPDQPDWRRLYIDMQIIIPPFLAWSVGLYPSFGASADFPGPEDDTPTGTITWYGPMIERVPPTIIID